VSEFEDQAKGLAEQLSPLPAETVQTAPAADFVRAVL